MTSNIRLLHEGSHDTDSTKTSASGTPPASPGQASPLFANLAGSQEVPPTSSTATGFSNLSLNAAGDALNYSLTVSGLDFSAVLGGAPQTPDTGDDVTLIHIHNGARGVNAPVALNLFQAGQQNQDADDFKIVKNLDNSVTLSGSWELTDSSTLPLNNFVSQIRNTAPGQDLPLYWNVHTKRSPGGEVRGQLQAANTVPLFANLTGSQEVPPTSSTATGVSNLSLNAVGDALSYSLTVSGLDFSTVLGSAPQTPDTGDDVTLIHIHNGARGVNAPVVLNLFQAGQQNQDADDFKIVKNADNSVTISGVWEQTDNSSQPLSNFISQIRSATPNQDLPLYWNVHTKRSPGGEIRGQLQQGSIPAPAPASGDKIIGGKKNDRLVGTEGDDLMRGLAGNDRLIGLAGDDRLDGGIGRNVMIGGDGADTFVLRKGKGINIVRDFTADDRLDLFGRLEFDDVTLVRQGRNTIVRAKQDDLARLIGVNPSAVTEAVFI